jgi:hypothetical protein
MYLLQSIISVIMILVIPQAAAYGTTLLIILAVLNLTYAIYMMSFKNLKGWWNRKVFEANQRINLKKNIEREFRRREGLGYDKLERGKANSN